MPNPSLVQLVVEARAELAKYSEVIDEESEEEVNISLTFRQPTPVSTPPDSALGDNDMNLTTLNVIQSEKFLWAHASQRTPSQGRQIS